MGKPLRSLIKKKKKTEKNPGDPHERLSVQENQILNNEPKGSETGGKKSGRKIVLDGNLYTS